MATNYFEVLDCNGGFKNDCVSLYGLTTPEITARYATLLAEYEEHYGNGEVWLFSAPGRIELVGNHTDHNGGKVLAAAINIDIAGVVSPSDDGIIRIFKDGFEVTVDTAEDMHPDKDEQGPFSLVKGVVDFFKRNGKKVGGFKASMHTVIPTGAGVSSSSAYELMSAEILNTFYNGGTVSVVDKARAAQYSENVFMFKPCGLMDQTAISAGGVNMIDFKSFTEPEIVKADWKFNKSLDIFVIATGGSHSDLTADYAAIPTEMKEVAAFFNQKLLKDVSETEFVARKDELAKVVSARAVERAEHYFAEVKRVEKAFDAIKKDKEHDFLDVVNASGESSRYKLQNVYSEKAGDHAIERALDFVQDVKGVVAKRVHGGGFAGTILVFVRHRNCDSAMSAFQARFGANSVFKVNVRDAGAIGFAKMEI